MYKTYLFQYLLPEFINYVTHCIFAIVDDKSLRKLYDVYDIDSLV